MLKKFLSKHYLLIGILLLAAFLRLYRIQDYMEFLGDQGRDVVIVANFLRHGNLFFIGPQTSIGNMYLGPWFYYLIAPSLLLANFNPVGPSVFIALLGIATVALIYFICLSWFKDKIAAYLAAFLYAISPVVIKYSDFSWNPNIMPFFALLFIFFMAEAVFRRRYSYFVYASFCFVMAINSHYLALILLIPAGLLWLYGLNLFRLQKKIEPGFIKNSFLAVALFLVSLLPQVLFDIKHHGQNIKAILTFFTYRETTVNIKPYKAIPEMFPLFKEVISRLVAGKDDTFGLYVSVILLLLFIFILIQAVKTRKVNRYLVVCVIWLLSGIVGLGLYKQHIYDHYFGFIYPVVFMLTGFAASWLIHKKSLILKLSASIFIIGLTVLSIINNPFRYSPPSQLSSTQVIVRSILADSGSRPFNLALLAKQNYDPPYRYYFTMYHAPLFDIHDKLTDQLYVICEPWQIECKPINNPLYDIAAFGWSKIDKQWQIGSIQLFRLVHTK